MIVSIKQEIEEKLAALYPGCAIYSEAAPESITTKTFFITLTGQTYTKRLNARYESKLSFDVTYYSDKDASQIKADCLEVQTGLIRAFDMSGSYRVINRQASITDNILHFKFDITYHELLKEDYVKMQQMQAETIILE